MRRLKPLLLLLACTGILQTAIAAGAAESSRTCLSATAHSQPDYTDCDRSDSTENNPRQPLRSLAQADGTPKLKGVNPNESCLSRLTRRLDDIRFAFIELVDRRDSVYLITRRIRI